MYLFPTTVAEHAHCIVNDAVKHLRQLGAVLVHTRGLLVVEPSIVKHQPHVLAELEGIDTNLSIITAHVGI